MLPVRDPLLQLKEHNKTNDARSQDPPVGVSIYSLLAVKGCPLTCPWGSW